jgi:hypothetical protein
LEFSFSTCLEVDEALVDQALAPSADLSIPAPRARIRALLRRMCEVAEPNKGAPRILLVLSRLARCPWLEGILVVRLRAKEQGTHIDLLEDDGISPERFCPAVVINAPFREFQRAVQLRPDLLRPLIADEAQPDRIELRASSRVEVASISEQGVANRSLLKPDRAARPAASISQKKTVRSLPPERPRPAAPEPPAPAFPAPAPPGTEVPPPTVSRPTADTGATTRIPAQQAAELIAKIKLKKQVVPVGKKGD